jgi:hydroxymethylbilane synthase
VATSKDQVRIGARGSPLAVAQANLFAARLREAAPEMAEPAFQAFTTTGDKIQDKPLTEAGGKGLFTKELDRAQELHEIDIAVHSLKDMTASLPEHLYLAAFLPREDPRDCLLGPSPTISGLPQGCVLGTSSLRRRSQALAIRPDLKVVEFRGNVQTRMRKLSEGVADATLLAAAGLRRLGMIEHAAGIIEVDELLPAGGQGIIGVTLHVDAPDWLKAAVAKTDDREARLAAVAERAFLRRLDGSCRTPIAAHLRFVDGGVAMAGEVLTDAGDRRWRADARLDHVPDEAGAEALGWDLGESVALKRSRDRL